MKRHITSFLLVALLASGPLFGFGGGFSGFPGFGSPFPGFNPGGIGADEEQAEEKSVEFAVLAGVSFGFGNLDAAPSAQLRLTVNRLQFMVDGTYMTYSSEGSYTVTGLGKITATISDEVLMVYGGVGYQLIDTEPFDLSASVVAGYGKTQHSDHRSNDSRVLTNDIDGEEGLVLGVDILAMLRLGEHFGIFVNGLLPIVNRGKHVIIGVAPPTLGIAWHF